MSLFSRFTRKHSYETMFGTLHVITMPDAEGRRVRIMELDGTFQSATYEGEDWAELAFEYYRGFDAIFAAEASGTPMNEVLMMGAGGFAWPKHALMTHPSLHVDVVELDPEIIRIARKHFYLDRLERQLEREDAHRLDIIVDDAFHYLATAQRTYDAIINDVFQAGAVPESTSSEEFFCMVKEHLAPGGIYAQNTIVDLPREGAYQLFALMARLNDAFRHVCTIDATDEAFGGAENHIILASDSAYPFEGRIDYSFSD